MNTTNIEQFCLRMVKGGLFLILLTPLVYSPITISISTFSETIFFRVILEIIAVFWGILLLINWRAYLPRLSTVLTAFLVWVGVLTLSGLLGFNPMRSFLGTLSRQEGILTYLHLLVFFAILISVIKEKKDWIRLFRGFVIVSVPVAFAGITQLFSLQWFKGIGCFPPECWRTSATLGNSGFYGKYLMLVLFVSLFLLILEEKKGWKQLAVFLMVLNGILLLVNGTRAAWVGMALGAMVFGIGWTFWIWKGAFSRSFVRAAGAILIVMAFLGTVLFIQKDQLKDNIIFERARNLASDVMNHENPRFPLWQVGLKAWKEHPWLGTGLESFMTQYDRFQRPEFRLSRIPELENFDRAHNVYVDMLVMGGILGLLSYLALWGTAFFMLFRNRERIGQRGALVLGAFLVASMTYNFFGFDLIATYIPLFIVLAFVASIPPVIIASSVIPASPFVIPSIARNLTHKLKFIAMRIIGEIPRLRFTSLGMTEKRVALLGMTKKGGLEMTTGGKQPLHAEYAVSWNNIKTGISAVLLVFALFSIYFFNFRPFWVSFSVVQANDHLNAGRVGQAMSGFRDALKGVSSWIAFDARRTVVKILHRAWQPPFNRYPFLEDPEKRQSVVEALPEHLLALETHLAEHGPDSHEMNSYLLAVEGNFALYSMAGQNPERLAASKRALKKALEMNPYVPILYEFASKIATMEGRLEDALTAAQKSYDLFPDQGQLLELQGKAYAIAGRNNGEKKNGVDLLRASLKVNSFYTKEKYNYGTVQHLAGLYLNLGERKAAAEFYEEVIALYPKDLPAPDIRLYQDLERIYLSLGEKKKFEETKLRFEALFMPG